MVLLDVGGVVLGRVAGGGREKPRRRRVCARAVGSVFVEEEALVG